MKVNFEKKMEWKSTKSMSTLVGSPMNLHLQNNVYTILPRGARFHSTFLLTSGHSAAQSPPWHPSGLSHFSKPPSSSGGQGRVCSAGPALRAPKLQGGSSSGQGAHLPGSSFNESRRLAVNTSRYCAFSSSEHGRSCQPLCVSPPLSVCLPASQGDFEHREEGGERSAPRGTWFSSQQPKPASNARLYLLL